MRVITADGTWKDRWNDYVEGHPASIAWHRFEWSEVVGRHYPIDFHPLIAITAEGETVKGVFPLYRAGDQLVSVAHAVAGGMLFDDDAAREGLLEAAIALMKSTECRRIVSKQYAVKIDGPLATDDRFYNRELSLQDEWGVIEGGFAEDNREVIRRRGADAYALDFSGENRAAYYRMLVRFQKKRGIPCVGEGWIDDLLAFDLYKLVMLRYEGRLIAGTLMKEFRDTVSFPFSCAAGVDRDHREHLFIFYWLLIKHYKEKGFRIVHSGRIPRGDDADDYRLGWGGNPKPYYYQYYPEGRGATEYGSKRGWKRRLFTAAWRIAPMFVVRAAGPRIVARFP